MSIAAFSAQRFYQIATGSPVAISCTHASLDIEIPQRGLHFVEAAADGTTHLAWLQGIIAPSKQRARFIRDIELRKLPRPIAHVQPCTGVRQAHYISLNDLQSHSRTIAALLDYTPHLIAAAVESRAAQCPECGDFSPIFLASSAICDEISRTWGNKNIEVELVGPCEVVESWASEHGFTCRSKDQNFATVRLDSFTCEGSRLLQIQPLIALTRRLGEAWITVRSETDFKEYAWHGRCSRCRHQMRAFQKSAARTLIERGANEDTTVEASRLIEGQTLGSLLASPIRDLISQNTTVRFIPAPQRNAIEALGLTELTLGTHTSTLSPCTIAKVALLASLSVERSRHDIVLFDAPRSLFSAQEHEAAVGVAETIAQNIPVVWLSETSQPRQNISSSQGKDANASLLGTVHLRDSSTNSQQVSCGSWIALDGSPDVRHERLGLAVYKALQGVESPLVAFAALHPFSAHFIPLFSEDSTATRLVAHQLGAIEPLAKMFAASHNAKMLGLSSRDFIIGQLRQSSTLCGTCKGTGLLHSTEGDLWREEVGPCPTCWGTRFRSPARDVTFKGKTMWEILNTPIRSSEQVLRALPKMKEVFELTTLLGLGDVALGTPTALLHTTQRRMLAIAHAILDATATKSSLIVVEAPFVGLNEQQRAGLQRVVEHPRFKERVAWLGVAG